MFRGRGLKTRIFVICFETSSRKGIATIKLTTTEKIAASGVRTCGERAADPRVSYADFEIFAE